MNVEALVVALEAMVLAIVTGEFGDSADFEVAAKRIRTFAREWVANYLYTWIDDPDSECGGYYTQSQWYRRVHDAMDRLEAEESNREDRIRLAFETNGEIAF